MMVAHPTIFYYLWIAPYVLQLGVAWVMYRRGLHRELPAFIYYCLAGAAGTVVLLATHHDPRVSNQQYLFLYICSVLVETGFRLATIGQIYQHLFQAYPGLAALGRSLFRSAIVLLLIVAVGLAVYAPPDAAWPLWNRYYMLKRTLEFIQCGLLLFLFVFASYFGLSFRRYTFGIALGFGVTLSVYLAISAIQSHIVTKWANFANYGVMSVNHLTALIWWYYLLVPERVSTASRAVTKTNLQEWNESLRRLLG